MLSTYRAVLNGDRITWLDTPPPQANGVEVHVTLLQPVEDLPATERSQALFELFGRLAESNPFRDITDPIQWQREIRQDRDLFSNIQ
jgi:hypothetical protein